MALRFVKDATRQESPRLKDTPQEPARNRSDGRAVAGRFGPRNRFGEGQGTKALIRKGLGDPEDPVTGERTREALRLYYALVGKLPSDGPSVRALCAAQARHTVLASAFATEASKAGLTTKEGLALAEASRAHDTTAQRMSVSAYDRSVREAKASPKQKPIWKQLLEGTTASATPTAPANTTAPSDTPTGQPDASKEGSE